MWLRVKKNVVLTRVDDAIYELGQEDITEELKLKNNWISDELDSLYKLPNSNTLKITFTNTQLTKKFHRARHMCLCHKCSTPWNKAGNLRSSHMLYKLLPVEHHNSRECPKERHYKRSSECSKEGNLWYEFRRRTNKCTNCIEKHSSLAMKCARSKTF